MHKAPENKTENTHKKTQGKIASQLLVHDRVLPIWARFMGFVFTSITSLCWIALIMCSIFFFDLVIAAQNAPIALALFLICLIPIVGVMVFDLAQVRALAGYRFARQRFSTGVRAGLGAGLCVVLFVVHPLLCLGIIVGAASLLPLRMLDKYLLVDDPLWDFNAAEATSILSGRDNCGLRLAHKSGGQNTQSSLSATMGMVALGLAGSVALTFSSQLVAQNIITSGAVLICVLITLWASFSINQYIDMLLVPNPLTQQTISVSCLPLKADQETCKGLVVHRLSVISPTKKAILKSVSFTAKPGKMVGIVGRSGAGKSLLFKAMSDPYDLAKLYVSGNIQYNCRPLWRSGKSTIYESNVPSVLVRARPHLLPDTALNNLTCFRSDVDISHVRHVLGELLFCENTVKRIIEAPDATKLSSGEKKAIGLARAFLLNPNLYMFDRPEADADEAMLNAIANKLKAECLAGRTALIISEHRGFRENCDDLIVMSEGMIIDSGTNEQITKRLETGWSRITVERKLESEDILHNWVRSHFRRFGDEENRRNACLMISELLAFSCASQTNSKNPHIMFHFKHEKGFCILNITDYGTVISTIELTLARKAAHDTKTRHVGISPLSEIIRLSMNFSQENHEGQRVLSVHIKTYDPRLVENKKQSLENEVSL